MTAKVDIRPIFTSWDKYLAKTVQNSTNSIQYDISAIIQPILLYTPIIVSGPPPCRKAPKPTVEPTPPLHRNFQHENPPDTASCSMASRVIAAQDEPHNNSGEKNRDLCELQPLSLQNVDTQIHVAIEQAWAQNRLSIEDYKFLRKHIPAKNRPGPKSPAISQQMRLVKYYKDLNQQPNLKMRQEVYVHCEAPKILACSLTSFRRYSRVINILEKANIISLKNVAVFACNVAG